MTLHHHYKPPAHQHPSTTQTKSILPISQLLLTWFWPNCLVPSIIWHNRPSDICMENIYPVNFWTKSYVDPQFCIPPPFPHLTSTIIVAKLSQTQTLSKLGWNKLYPKFLWPTPTHQGSSKIMIIVFFSLTLAEIIITLKTKQG